MISDNTIRVSTYIPVELANAIGDYALVHETSMSKVIAQAIKEKLNWEDAKNAY